MSLSKLATFPNEMLVSIFSRIPLPQRLRLRGVCNRWWSVIEDRCLSQETALVIRQLFIKADGSRRSPHGAKPNDLIVPSDRFNEQLGQLLIRLMPASTSSLSLYYDWSTDQSGLARFLALFTERLVSLSLHHIGGFLELSMDLNAFLFACTRLTRLELYRMKFLCLDSLAPMLCRLQQLVGVQSFGFSFYRFARCCITANQLTHLAVHDNFFLLNLDFNETLASKITHLHLGQCEPPDSLSVMAKFTSLRCLTLNLYDYLKDDEEEDIDMEAPVGLGGKLLHYFKPVKQLSELTLKNLTYWEGYLKNAPLEAQLVSVVKLSLQVDIIVPEGKNWNVSAFLKALASWFPNLKLLIIACYVTHQEAIKASAGDFICPIKVLGYHGIKGYTNDFY